MALLYLAAQWFLQQRDAITDQSQQRISVSVSPSHSSKFPGALLLQTRLHPDFIATVPFQPVLYPKRWQLRGNHFGSRGWPPLLQVRRARLLCSIQA